MTTQRDLVEHIAVFAGELRQHGIPVGLSDERDAIEALVLVDVSDRREVHDALRSAFKVRRRDWDVFRALFRQLWSGSPSSTVRKDRRTRKSADRKPTESGRAPAPQLGTVTAEETSERPQGESPGYTPVALLRRKPFDECSALDLTAMEDLLHRLTIRLATRKSRRLVSTRRRGLVDLRRSFRRALGTGGDLVDLARRHRPIEEPRLVLLCDTSGSMDPHTRFLLTFVLSLRNVARRAEIFCFNTELVRLTSWLSARKIAATLDRLARGVPDWSGGTKIGESLETFVERFQPSMVDSRTTVVILSDGLDRGDPGVLAGAMRDIHSRARRVVWLNPLMGDDRYEPTARGMAAALPYIDHFATAHNLASLEKLIPVLAA